MDVNLMHIQIIIKMTRSLYNVRCYITVWCYVV